MGNGGCETNVDINTYTTEKLYLSEQYFETYFATNTTFEN